MTVLHPARYSSELLPLLTERLRGYRRILDPMAGTGERLAVLAADLAAEIVGVELEAEWAACTPSIVRQGDSTSLPFADASFDAICVSPPYGNRMADTFAPGDASRRYTYRLSLGRPLPPNSVAGLQWGDGHRDLQRQAWVEAVRVLRPGGRFVLSVADHIRGGVRQPVTAWHIDTLVGLGLRVVDTVEVVTPKLRHGSNELRCPEMLFVLDLAEHGADACDCE
jgi:tRNA G10  N-methylase Trm11